MHSINACRRRARQDFALFKALIATPGNLVTGVTLPGNCLLMASTSATLVATGDAIDVGARTLGLPAAAAGVVHRYDGIERGNVVTKAAGASGTVSLYIDNGLGKPVLIAQG